MSSPEKPHLGLDMAEFDPLRVSPDAAPLRPRPLLESGSPQSPSEATISKCPEEGGVGIVGTNDQVMCVSGETMSTGVNVAVEVGGGAATPSQPAPASVEPTVPLTSDLVTSELITNAPVNDPDPILAPQSPAIATPITEEVATPITEEIATPITEEITTPITEKIAVPITEEVDTPITEEVAMPITEEVATPITDTPTSDITSGKPPQSATSLQLSTMPTVNDQGRSETIPPYKSSSSSGKKKKKKKKHSKHHTHNPISAKSHVTTKTPMTSEEIGSEISQIDQFLQSLKMGVVPLQVAAPATAVGSKVAAEGSKVTAERPKVTAEGSKVVASRGQSLGMELIGQCGSSSSSDDDSDSSSSDSSEDDIAMVTIEEGSDEEMQTKPKNPQQINFRDLPPLESCDVPFPEGAQLLALGAVSHITEELVVIQSLKDTPPVDEGTVLWTQDKKSLSVIFEIFGPVKCPYYSVHVRSPDHAHTLGLDPGRNVYIIPGNAELTKYVFTQQLLQQRGSDASWKDDQEVPEELQDFSDDEAEQQKKKKSGKRQNKEKSTQSAPKKQAPRYSGDPKMSAYFPRAARPSPRPRMAPPPNRGMVYFTPRGFVGYLPPQYPPPGIATPMNTPPYYQAPPVNTPHYHQAPPMNTPPYQHYSQAPPTNPPGPYGAQHPSLYPHGPPSQPRPRPQHPHNQY